LNRHQALLGRWVLAGVLFSAACLIGLAAFSVGRGAAFFGLGGALNAPAFGASQVNALGTPLPGSGAAPQPLNVPGLAQWDGASQVNILLLGLDYRDWEAGSGPSRSDTMILLTLDPLTQSAGMLSIPRDLWVAIPGFKHGKINTAYFLGDAYKLPGGGPALAIKTVEEFLGVPIHYFAQVDFGAFVRFIDEIGGVKIDVPEKITVDLLGSGSKTKKTLQPGVQLLPGEWALAYARARYTQGGDFDRARRQQQVILGIRNRVLELNMLPELIAKAPVLYQELASGVHTNLTLDQMLKLAAMAQQVPEDRIQRGVLDTNYVQFGQSPDGLSILIPIPDKIHTLRDQIFVSAGNLGPEAPGTPVEQMQAESARLAVLNGSGVSGLAERTANYLKQQGANVAQTGDAGQSYAATRLVDHTGSPYALKYLAELFKVSPDRIQIQPDFNAGVDVEVILGSDWAQSNPLP
jgi:LCP family protein required for cell wall assembly